MPYLTYYSVFYIAVFSAIPHKEFRFLVPLIPFTLLTTGEHIAMNLKDYKCLYRFVLWLYIVANVGVITFMSLFHQRAWEVPAFLVSKGEPVHSLYSMEHFMTPHYSWFHGLNTKLYPISRDPKFVRLSEKDPLPLADQAVFTSCIEMIHHITAGDIIPQYIQIPRLEGNDYETELCNYSVKYLEIDGNRLYNLEKQFKGDVIFELKGTEWPLR